MASEVANDTGATTVLSRSEATIESATFTQDRVERVLGLVVGVGSCALGLQAFFNALTSPHATDGWRQALMLGAFAPLTLMIIACFAAFHVRLFAGMFAVAYPLILLLWPASTAGSATDTSSSEPWIWYLINVATVAAVLAFAMAWQLVWAIGVPVLYGLVRSVQLGFTADQLIPTVLDVVFAMILAGVLLALAWMLRSVGADIDRTRVQALKSYASAAAADAAEQERVAVAALMHDSVLAALIAAERATTPRERTLAVSMAREALTRLANADQDAGEGPDEPLSVESIAAEIDQSARDLGALVVIEHDIAPDARPLPGRVARALVLAAVQAIANAVAHADATDLRVRVDAARNRVSIRVSDAGPGFDESAVPDDRLGIRGSIRARLAAVAGHTHIESSPLGTSVIMEWEWPQ